MKKAQKNTRHIARSETDLKKLLPWMAWGLVIWLFVFVGISYGILADVASTPSVPDWVVPYDATTKSRVETVARGYPIVAMSEYIARFDETTAGYLVAIAKKESNWGKRVPVSKDGHDCYNYWGFRDPDNTRGSGGHSCFASPEQAVRIVGKRVRELVHTYKRDTPRELVVWKCGSACDPSDVSVEKWIQDVAWGYDIFMQDALERGGE